MRHLAAGFLFAVVTSGLGRGQCGIPPIQHLFGSDVLNGEEFGYAVATDGQSILVSATKTDGGALDDGAVYVFEHDGVEWVETQKLIASDPLGNARFGQSLAVDGDMAFVGSRSAKSGGVTTGAAYVFHKLTGTWVEIDKLVPPSPTPLGCMGFSVAMDGAWAAVADFCDDTIDVDAGTVHVFQRSGNQWLPWTQLFASDASLFAGFGFAVDMDGDRIVVGTRSAQAVYVFRDTGGGNWVEEARLTAWDGNSQSFGTDVAIEGPRIAVGTPDGGTPAAHFFSFDGSQWSPEITIQERSTDFGIAVEVSDAVTLIGAPNFRQPTVLAYEERPSVVGPQWFEIFRTAPGGGTSLSAHGGLVVGGYYFPGGAAFVGRIEDLSLNVTPAFLAPGASASLSACGGSPTRPLALYSWISGLGTPLFLLGSSFAADGTWTTTATVPTGFSGMSLELQALGVFDATGAIAWSNRFRLFFL